MNEKYGENHGTNTGKTTLRGIVISVDIRAGVRF
jgi:hypothetical protein